MCWDSVENLSSKNTLWTKKKWSRHKWWRAGPDVSEEEKEETEILGSSISNEKAVKKGEFHGEG